MRNINEIGLAERKQIIVQLVKNKISFEDFKAAYELGLSLPNLIIIKKQPKTLADIFRIVESRIKDSK